MADHPFTGTLSVTGNVGIGTEPLPNTQLYIRSSTEQSQVLVENSVGALLKLAVNSGGVTIGTDTGTSLPFSLQTNGVSHVSINNSGLVEVSGPLSIQNTLTVTGNAIVGTDDTPASLAVKGPIEAGSATITGPLTVQTNLTVQNNLTVEGNLQVTGTTTFRDLQRHEGDLELGDEDTDQVRIHGVVRSTHSSGALQIGSPLDLSSSLTAVGNATLNNVFLGNVGHGALWAGFSHSNSVTTAGYGLLQHRDGIFTLLNKKSGGGYLGFRVDNADKMIINDAGNVGIGTTEPRTQLHVLGRISTGRDFTSAGAITFYPPDGFAWFHIDNGPAGGRPMGRLRISHGGSPGTQEIISILQNMNVGIGTTTPAARLHVPGGAILNGLAVGVKPPGVINPPFPYETVSTTDTGWNLRLHSFNAIYFHAGNSNAPQFGVNRNGTWFSSSRQLKEDISALSLQEAWQTLSELNPVKFIFKEDPSRKFHTGFIAEEVPDLIGNPEKTMISEMDIVAVLTRVVQEQQMAIATLTERVKLLEGNL
ncbi:tail fiber domain-containing protein [Leptothermofonsia sichuanensis E412]|uniref:tail fiber domain-containing protein n=1 Tax=Leptothermofonsia sichuanensis TaxID=2917832 RepID=UPI001CA7AA65|nr:tail fiber domain-containing protein [Leptothermofonsia sichuanensis]QZZ22011.1 tail fiber domain-containing protein [Leptothermofonsia sichuanensis E412]